MSLRFTERTARLPPPVPPPKTGNAVQMAILIAGPDHCWADMRQAPNLVQRRPSQLYRTAAEIKSHFLNLEENKGLEGCIILMHLGTQRNSDYPYTILDDLISGLKTRGYTFTEVSKLLRE